MPDAPETAGFTDSADAPVDPAVLLAGLLTVAGLVGQLVLVVYPEGQGWLRWAWLVAGLLLLWLVLRHHSNVARWALVVWGGLGVFSFASATLAGDPTLLRGVGLVVAFGLQVVAMLRPAVVAHCRVGRP